MLPTMTWVSATATSSPVIRMTGTPKDPAMAAFRPPSDMAMPFSRSSVTFALDIVCARTPRLLEVLE